MGPVTHLLPASPAVPASLLERALQATVRVCVDGDELPPRVGSTTSCELASGFLLALDCGPCLVTAAHALRGMEVEAGSSGWKRWVEDHVRGSTGPKGGGLSFRARPVRAGRHTRAHSTHTHTHTHSTHTPGKNPPVPALSLVPPPPPPREPTRSWRSTRDVTRRLSGGWPSTWTSWCWRWTVHPLSSAWQCHSAPWTASVLHY